MWSMVAMARMMVRIATMVRMAVEDGDARDDGDDSLCDNHNRGC